MVFSISALIFFNILIFLDVFFLHFLMKEYIILSYWVGRQAARQPEYFGENSSRFKFIKVLYIFFPLVYLMLEAIEAKERVPVLGKVGHSRGVLTS